MQTESFSPKHIWGPCHLPVNVSVTDSDYYIAMRIGSGQFESTARLDIPDAIRLDRKSTRLNSSHT